VTGVIKYASEVIPPMTHELSSGWDQPNLDAIQIDDEIAYMREATFKKLKDYSNSQPSGVYEGKMWRSNSFIDNRKYRSWVLKWFDFSDDPNMCSTHWREIGIIYTQDQIEESFKRIK